MDFNHAIGSSIHPGGSSDISCSGSSLGLYAGSSVYIRFEPRPLDLTDKGICDVSIDQIQHVIFDPVDETSIPRSSSMNSTGSDARSGLSDVTNEYICDFLPKPHHQEASHQKLTSYRGWWDEINWIKKDDNNLCNKFQTTGREAPVDKEEFSSLNQYSMSPVKGTQHESSREEKTRRYPTEFSFWKNSVFDLMHKNSNPNRKFHMLKSQTRGLHANNVDLKICNNQPELKTMYPLMVDSAFSSLINRFRNEVGGPELEAAQRDLTKVMIGTSKMNFQIGDLKAKFTQLDVTVNQLRLQIPTSVKELNGAIHDFMCFKRDCVQTKHCIARLTADICRFSVTVGDLQTSNALTNDLVTEWSMILPNLEMQIAQFFERIYELTDGSFVLEEVLRIEHTQASRESTQSADIKNYGRIVP
jgi:hypothetical protein